MTSRTLLPNDRGGIISEKEHIVALAVDVCCQFGDPAQHIYTQLESNIIMQWESRWGDLVSKL